ncbi:hypothetical protein [Desulfobacter sp.]
MPDQDHSTLNQKKTKPGDISLMSEDDLFLFNEGSHFCLYDKLGAHPMEDTAGGKTWKRLPF